MIIQAYTVFPCTLQITAATPRPDMMASSIFTAAGIHEDYCSRVRSLLAEHRHVGTSSLAYPAAKRLQTYFPIFPLLTGKPLYKLISVKPLGAPRDIDDVFKLEVMRIRYEITIVKLNAAFLADEILSEAMERHLEFSIKSLFKANGVPETYIYGDQDQRPGDRTVIDIICEVGAASERDDKEIPTPTS